MYWIALFTTFSGLLAGTAQAQTQNLQLTKLYCSIREGKFLTHLEFKVQLLSDHPEMTGEISNFQILSDGSRKYLSGILFTHIRYDNRRVSGDTGDPSDLIGMFVLTRLDSRYAGKWSYWYRRSESEVIKANFNCSYDDTPPSRRWHRRPR